MGFKENPKTKGSGILTCIPQTGRCLIGCEDCFFQSGRSYLEPLEKNLPNMPPLEMAENMIVRVNDGNDSSNDFPSAMENTMYFRNKFYNTSMVNHLQDFDAPFVLTINPKSMTDKSFHQIKPLCNLMFVRFRTNTWNWTVANAAVEYYTSKDVPVVLTFMAYYNGNIPESHQKYYQLRKRVLNEYQAITTEAWQMVMERYRENKYVYSCGREGIASGCKFCGNCLREYFATLERMKKPENSRRL